MGTQWAVWIGVLFIGAILLELIRLNIVFAAALKKEVRISESNPSDIQKSPDQWPTVSVIMPAKDEEAHVEHSVRSFLASDYPKIELLLVNDRCQDRTLEIMQRLAKQDSRIKVVSIEELPDGWTGKTHAMFQAYRHASGEVLLFTDADVIVKPDTLSLAVNYFEDRHLDMLSLLPSFTKRGFIEDAIHTHLALGIAFFYPLPEVNDRAKPAGLASGCFIMMTRHMYEEVGTWERFRKELTEDVALSKAVKARGGNLMVLRGGEMLCTRPFERISDVRMFWKRTFYGGLDKSVPKLLRLAVNYLVLTIMSALFLASSIVLFRGDASLPMVMLFSATTMAMIATVVPLIILIRQEKGHWPYGLTVPVGTIIGVWVTLDTAAAIIANDGIRWRGSVYK